MGETDSETEEKALAPSEEEETSSQVSLWEAELLESAPPEVVRALEKVPPEARRQFATTFFSMIMSRGPMPDPVASKIADKVTEEHITELIRSSGEDSERQFKDCQWGRLFRFAIAVIGLVFFGFLVVQLKSNPDLLKDLIIGAGGFLGGLGTGLGYMAIKRRG